jgi:hypothetical protein
VKVARLCWNRFWFTPASPLGLMATRVIVAGNALWLLLSRPDTPQMVAWPPEFLTAVDGPLAARFLLVGLPVSAEWALFALAHVCLGTAVIGLFPRASSAAAAILLYHFAPFEQLITGGGALWFQGLTQPILILFLLSFVAPASRTAEWSSEWRWPVAAAQVLFSLTYIWAGVGKLRYSGLAWFSSDRIRDLILAQMSKETLVTPWAAAVAASPLACWSIGGGTLIVELLWPLVLVSGRARAVLVPLAVVGHIGTAGTLGLVFLNLPLVLLFVDWDAVHRQLVGQGRPGTGPAEGRVRPIEEVRPG